MDDYISREAVLKRFEQLKDQTESLRDKLYLDGVAAVIDTLPAADVAPAVHAKWVFNGICTSCSACGSNKPTKAHDYKLAPREVRFCYFCGAKMDLEESK